MGIMEREKFRVPASVKNLGMVREKVRDCTQRAGVEEKTISQIVLAVDEAVTNVIRHSYGNDGTSEVEIEVTVGDGKIQLAIRDRAEEFDPTGHPDPDIAAHVKAGRKSGLGIFLMRKVMDDIQHCAVNGWNNELLLTKNIPSEGGEDA